MQVGMWGAVIGSLLGLLGGVIGTYFGIRSTRSPRERRFAVRAAVLMWLGVSVFLALLIGLSSPSRFLLWVPSAAALSGAIVWMNRRLARIKLEESQT